MAEPTNGGTDPQSPPSKKELPMEVRLLLAFLLMGAVLFLTPYFYKSTAPPPAKKSAVPVAAEQKEPKRQEVQAAAKTAETVETPAPKVPVIPPATAQKAETYVITTDLYQITFTNQGAVVQSWLLRKYKHDGQPLELVNTASTVELPFSLYFKGQKPAVDLNRVLYVAKPDSDGLGITYEYSDGQVACRKTFRFRKDSFVSTVTTEATENGKPLPNLITWRGGFGDVAALNPSGNEQSLYYDTNTGKIVKEAAKAAKSGPVSASGRFLFAGIEDQYFAAAFLPQVPSDFESMTFSDTVPTSIEQKAVPFVGTAVGGTAVNRFDLFVGPKDRDVLRAVNPKLEGLVDFGWFSFLAKPLFLAVHWVNNKLVHNYGWSIVLVTIIINFLIFPLKISSMRSMKKMQSLQPQIAAINQKYKGISVRDPKKQEQNAEMMDLYKKHGVNPMGGCVPMLLQVPFFIAFYKVISVSIEMRGANWLWVADLSQPEHWAGDFRILPLAMIVSQFVMQKMTPSTTPDPNQQKMMLIMPLVFGFMFYGLSSGLVLYYLTSNLVGIAQQLFFNRTITVADLAQPVQVKKKQISRK